MIVACCLFKFFPYGGLSRDFRRIALALLAKGHTVRVYVQKWEGEKIDGIEIFEYSGNAFTNDGAVHQYCRFVKESSICQNIFPGLNNTYGEINEVSSRPT